VAIIWALGRPYETTEFLKDNLSKFKHLKFLTVVWKGYQTHTPHTLGDTRKGEIDWEVLTEKPLWEWIELHGGVQMRVLVVYATGPYWGLSTLIAKTLRGQLEIELRA
jgi:hypothetical protein